MDGQEFDIYRQSDTNVVEALIRVRNDLQGPEGGSVNIYVAGAQNISDSLNNIAGHTPMPEILKLGTAVVTRFQVSLNNDIELNVIRDQKRTYDSMRVAYAGNDTLVAARLLGVVKKYLRPLLSKLRMADG